MVDGVGGDLFKQLVDLRIDRLKAMVCEDVVQVRRVYRLPDP